MTTAAAALRCRLVTFAQDHDQIGNRAAGDRLSQSLTPDRLAVAAVLTLTAPGTPMLFMGEEWGASTPWQFFTSHPEPELGEATAKGRIEEFARMGWDPATVPDPQDPETYHRSHLAWEEAGDGEQRQVPGCGAIFWFRFGSALGVPVPFVAPRVWARWVGIGRVTSRLTFAICA